MDTLFTLQRIPKGDNYEEERVVATLNLMVLESFESIKPFKGLSKTNWKNPSFYQICSYPM